MADEVPQAPPEPTPPPGPEPETPDPNNPPPPVMIADNEPVAATFGADDLGRAYLKGRQTAGKTAALDWLSRGAEEPKPTPHNPAQPVTATSVAKDIGKGAIEAPSQVAGGIADAVNEAKQALGAVGQWVEDSIGSGGIKVGADGIELIDHAELQALRAGGKDGMAATDLPTTHAPSTVTGGLVRGVAQFLTGFLPASAALKATGAAKALGAFGTAAAAGAVADATVFDPHAERLSNLIEEFPALANPVTEYLSAQPDDGEAEGRLKNAVEGLGLGTLVEGFIRAVRVVRPVLKAKAPTDAPAAAVDDIVQAREAPAPAPDLTALGDDAAPLVRKPRKGSEIPPEKMAGWLNITGETEGHAININLARLNTSDDVKAAIDATAKTFRTSINAARRDVITHQQTAQLADEMGLTVDDLLARRKGEAFNAETALAARRLLVGSGAKVVELAKQAAGGSETDQLAFRRALSVHAAIQHQVSGLTAEAGRALSQFNIKAGPAAEQARAITTLLGQSGDSQKMAAMVAALDTPEGLATFARQADKATTGDMVMEAWINGLLSGPQTHVVNMLSNSLTAMWSVPERTLAAGFRRLTGGEGVAQGEGMAQAFGLVHGFEGGLKLAWKALKSGEPTDALSKLEMQKHRAITAENLELSGVAGRAVDFLGEVVRTPGRLLMASDELWKATGYRMELYATAFRTAKAEGLEGSEMGKRIASIVADPPEHIEMAAIDAARYQTFTKDLGESGKAFMSWANKTPGARVVFPFIRTPTNILKYVGSRTPLAPLSSAIRADIAAGGARRDLALARISLGSMVMAASADYAMQGNITGAGPTAPELKATLRRTGWQPYSIKIGDTYHSYNRLDPLGALLGLAADTAEIIGQLDSAEADEIAAATVMAVSNNVVNKTYLQGFSDLVSAFSQVSPEAGAARGANVLKQLAGTLVPTGVATIERTVDPAMRDARTMLDQIRSRVPGFSDSLPPTRNLWGEPVLLQGGIGPDIISPVYTSEKTHSPIDDEMARLGMGISMPPRSLNGVELSADEYSRYVELAGHGAVDPSTGNGAKAALERIIQSPEYQQGSDGPDGTKALVIKKIVTAYRELARAQLRDEYPDLNALIHAKAMTR